ncbi:hypothetical protein CROQUDRAFT_57235 [Cronartium quercuum f. sp. fusiforme G11]|uniref:Autophagy-related protein n=1 Tax=Cronartium quercuum f. sp. fusiforme G11 TaxID=708437 RepID=A0A9P6NVU7_9BASI|nr:hypothetical protein CROQUDRAFT_57235 [Cronartium quercuum f. sp. fusiforme G11]
MEDPHLAVIPSTDSKAVELVNADPPLADSKQVEDGSWTNDHEPVVSQRELWSYYLYYNGNNGVGPMGYSFTLFQSLITAAGHDPNLGEGSSCQSDGSGECVVPFGGRMKSVTSVALVANGLAFAIMTLLFTTFGGAADHGSFGRYFLLALTLICWASQYSTIALNEDPMKWKWAMVLYIIGFVSYGATLVFYAAAFPRLARHTPKAKAARDPVNRLSDNQLETELSLERNRISNISTVHSNLGFLFVSLLNLSILIPLAGKKLIDTYTIILTNTYWVILGVWWFIFQAPRPGPLLPADSSYWTIGWIGLLKSFRQAKQLPMTFTYLIAFFLLADGLNTTGTLVGIVQANQIEFSFLDSTYLGITQAITSILSTAGFWLIQKRWKFRTKTMFVITNIVTVMIPAWGLIGIWTSKIGFHHRWEFWLYNVIFGLFQAPYYAYSQTIMAELSPPGFENMGFAFLFPICLISSLIIWFTVDIERGKLDAATWAADQKID